MSKNTKPHLPHLPFLVFVDNVLETLHILHCNSVYDDVLAKLLCRFGD